MMPAWEKRQGSSNISCLASGGAISAGQAPRPIESRALGLVQHVAARIEFQQTASLVVSAAILWRRTFIGSMELKLMN